MSIFGPLSALALIAFLVFATTGIVWLALSLLQGDPEVSRRRAGVIAITSGAVLVAVVVAGLIFRPAFRGAFGPGITPQRPFMVPGAPQFPPRLPRQAPAPQPTPSATR